MPISADAGREEDPLSLTPAVRTSPSWTQVVQLAQRLQAARITDNDVDPMSAERLARAVLDFQGHLVGGMAKGVSEPARLEPEGPPLGEVAPTRALTWPHVIELAERFEKLRLAAGKADPVTAVSLARAILEFHEQLGVGFATKR